MENEVRPVRVVWQKPGERAEGLSYGYTNLTRNIEANIRHDQRAKVALHACQPRSFQPTAGKVNLLLTMWESRDLVEADLRRVRQADALIVPSTFCVDVFRPHVDCPIYLVPLGVDVERLPYCQRVDPRPAKPFRWLSLASPDPRKGYAAIIKAWEARFFNRPDCELYFKSTAHGKDGIETVGNVTLDWRNVDRDEIAGIYAAAHGLLYPSAGEGFGWTPAEAFATGLPVVGTMWSGHADFFNHSNGYPIKHDLGRARPTKNNQASTAEDGRFEVALPVVDSLISQMSAVMKDYHKARKKARLGADLIRRKYTWPLFRYRLAKVVARYA